MMTSLRHHTDVRLTQEQETMLISTTPYEIEKLMEDRVRHARPKHHIPR